MMKTYQLEQERKAVAKSAHLEWDRGVLVGDGAVWVPDDPCETGREARLAFARGAGHWRAGRM
jgi:hypothetical protein